MHMADALLSPVVSGIMWAAAGTAVAVSSRAMTRTVDHGQVPLMGVMGAFVFAAQMVNFTIPGTGSSGHFAGGMLLSLLLGPHAAFLTMASVLIVQALFFADGGLLALGANIFNMGFVPCFIVYPLIFLPLAGGACGRVLVGRDQTSIAAQVLVGRDQTSIAAQTRRRAAIWTGAIVALQLGALGVVIETTASGIAELPFATFVLAMLPIHLAIGIAEGLITLTVVEFVGRFEPEMFAGIRAKDAAGGVALSRRTLGLLAVLALVAGSMLPWFASSHPDGLEWSVARLTGQAELATQKDRVHTAAASLQAKTAILPSYAFPGAEAKKENAGPAWGTPSAGTSVSGLAGGALTLLLAGFAGWLFRRRPPLDNASSR